MMMANDRKKGRRGTLHLAREDRPAGSPLLSNLLRDTDASILAYIAEQYGLRRVPGLSRSALVERLLTRLPDYALRRLEDDLIAARYGSLSLDELLEQALEASSEHAERAGTPKWQALSAENAMLVEGSPRRWEYAMHGYDVVIDLQERLLGCDCEYFRFSSHHQALCKHLAFALTLIPETYAREALIDLLVSRQYGGPETPHWEFEGLRAA